MPRDISPVMYLQTYLDSAATADPDGQLARQTEAPNCPTEDFVPLGDGGSHVAPGDLPCIHINVAKRVVASPRSAVCAVLPGTPKTPPGSRPQRWCTLGIINLAH